ncbi:MAG: endonuclease/exonuclease/phosphatase family protein, partial [Anaerolineae bacterium]|nr:endonuclease/exonuclease/phosphatase family protein [Anaerolineae bacterium]
PANCDTDTAAGWLPREIPTPGQITLEGDCPTPRNPAQTNPLQPIGEIQGSGDYSHYVNQIVDFRGIVTGIQADQNTAGTTYYTLFVQDIPGLEDGDAATSDAIPVFFGWERPFLQIGDQVHITGLVTEFFGLTETDSDGLEIIVEASEQPLPDPILIDPPADSAAYFEALEGMLVALPEARVIGPTHAACGFAVVAPTGPERLIRRSEADPIGQIVPVLNHTDVFCDDFPQVKTGDTLTGLSGPLTYHFDQFKIVQQHNEALSVTAVPNPPLAALPTIQPSQITIATLNMENHFDGLDDTGDEAEPKPAPADIALRQTKLAHAINQTLACPTLIGVQEVEKKSLLEALADDLAESCGFRYTVTHLESPDVRGIDLALLSNPDRVQVQAASLQQGCTQIETGIVDETAVCPPSQSPLFSRPPLQAQLTIDGSDFTIYVNHFKSKRGGDRETAVRRLAQAQHLADLVDAALETNPDAHIIVLGDFNDYENSPPMQFLAENGRLTNTLQQIPEAERYSYNFSGASQLIDGILVSPALAEQIAAVTIRHTNADYPDSLSHDTSPANLPYKATDHDLPLLVLNPPSAPISPTPTTLPDQTPPDTASSQPANPALWLLAGAALGGTAVIGGLAVARRRQSE